jgi:hypothetical protein
MSGRAGHGYDSAHPAVQALLNTPAGELTARRAQLQAAAQAAGLSADDIREVLNSRRELPRPLLPGERAILLAVLNYQDFDGRDELVAQVDAARVDGYCGCGCATVDLTVDPAAPSAPKGYWPIPNEAIVIDAAGEPIGGIIIFVDGGYLLMLQILSDQQPISPLPPLDRLQPFGRTSWRRADDEDTIATALAQAVANYAAGGIGSTPLPYRALGSTLPYRAIGSTPLPYKVIGPLDDLLRKHGGDDIQSVSVEEFLPTRITIIGVSHVLPDAASTHRPHVAWGGLFEATFQLDKARGAVTALTIRTVNELSISRGDAPEWDPADVQSWRETLRIIASRSTNDEDWADVLHYEFD